MTDTAAGSAQDNFPINCWYVAATGDEVGPALWRAGSSAAPSCCSGRRTAQVAALEDRCAHRAAPLSRGSLVDDQVVCPYHGFTYDAPVPACACLRNCTSRTAPGCAATRCARRGHSSGSGWAQPPRSRHAEPPALPVLADPAWAVQGGALDVAANYLLLHDNALDRTHFPFVHPHRIHRGYVEQPPTLNIEVSETTVSDHRSFAPAPLADWQAEATGLPRGGAYVQRETGTFVSPAMHVDAMDILGEDGTVLRSQFIRAFTPVDAAHTRVVWRAARNYAVDDASVTERLREVYEGTMTEDQPLLETIQATAGPADYRVNATADAAAIRAFEIIKAMLAEERPRPSPRR